MYYQSDKKAATKEIQKYLYVLSGTKYPQIPRIPIDGAFDIETEAAVIEFQKIKNISPTGKVDYETFTELYIEYLSVIEDESCANYILGDGKFPLKENDQNEDVKALHIMINELRKTYPQISDPPSGSYFSAKTANAIEDIRRLFLMPSSRELDKALYRRMLTELNRIKDFEEKY